MEHNILEVKNICKQYKDFTLDHVSFQLPAGCIMGFIGENGAGKSTTIKAIMDLEKKDSGSVTIFGKDNETELKSVKEDIGVVVDECCFPDNLSIHNIRKIMKNIYKNWEENTFQNYIERFSLPEKKTVKNFSKGMKMKLSIAVALSHRPKLLILDEATSGLDPMVREEILDVFLDFIQDENHSILISSHITSDLEKICDYITFIHHGKIIFTEEKDELLEKYAILKCNEEDLDAIPADAVKGKKKHKFGVEALVEKEKVNSNFLMEKPSLEEIMLYLSQK